jgi:hypothetical protein
MQLPIDKIFLFPDIKYKIVNRRSLELCLEDIFSFFDYEGDAIVTFLERALEDKKKKKALAILEDTEITAEDIKAFQEQTKEINEILLQDK